MKKKLLLSITIIVIIAMMSTITVFACTYNKSVSKGNVCTVTYYRDGSKTTTYSWGNTNNHPSINYSENYQGYTHSGTLPKVAYSAGPVTTTYSTNPTSSWIKFTTQKFTGYYSGSISSSSHYI